MNKAVENKKTRVVVIASPPTPYRLPFYNLIGGREDLDVTVLFCGEFEPTREFQMSIGEGFRHEFLSGFPITFHGRDQFFYFINPGILSRLAKTGHECLVVAGYFLFSSQAGILRSLFKGVPYLVWSESHLGKVRSAFRNRMKEVFLRPLLRRASGYLVTGTLSAQYMMHYGAKKEEIFRLCNTPDVNLFIERGQALSERKQEIRRELGIDPDAAVALFVGRLVEKKGLQHLLPAFRRVREQVPKALMVIVGDGPYRTVLEPHIRELGDAVRMEGFRQVEDLPKYYAAADLFACPSLDEPWGVVINEAMASGLPVVASTACGATPDLIRAGVNGIAVEPGDTEGIAAAVTKILSLGDRGREMGLASREIIRDWTPEQSAEDFARAVKFATGQSRELSPWAQRNL